MVAPQVQTIATCKDESEILLLFSVLIVLLLLFKYVMIIY